MNNAPNREEPKAEAFYTIETRQFVVRRFFGEQKTVKDLLAAEISHGILQNVPLNNLPAPDRMES